MADWLRRPRATVLLLLVLTLCALPFALRLRLSGEVLEMLPESSPAAESLRMQAEIFGELETIYVMVTPTGADPLPPERLATLSATLARELRRRPEVRAARSGLSPAEQEYFRLGVVRRAPLFLPAERHHELMKRLQPEEIASRVQELRVLLMTPLGGGVRPWVTVDPLGLAELLPGPVRGSGGFPVDTATGSFLASDGQASLVVVEPATDSTSPAAGRRLRRALESARRAVNRKSDVRLRLDAVGGPLYAAADEEILRRDLIRTVLGSLGLGFLILVLGFGSLRRAVAVLIPVPIALVWTAAVATALLGELTAVGVGFAAILIGLGVDYGIHLLGRSRAPTRGRGVHRQTTIGPGVRLGLIGSALTTAAGFGILGLAEVRPIRELGVLIAIGTLSVLAVSMLGAEFLVRLGGAADRSRSRSWAGLHRLIEVAIGVCRGSPMAVALGALALTGMAVIGLSQLRFEVNLRNLRPAEHPLLQAEERIVSRFRLGLDTAAVLVPAPDTDAVLERADEVAKLLRARLPTEATILSPSDWLLTSHVARRRAERLVELPWAAAAETLRRRLARAGLAPAAFRAGLQALDELAVGRPPSAPRPPSELSRLVVTDGGRTWAAVRLRLPTGTGTESLTPELIEAVRGLAPGTRFASVARLGSELESLALRDLRRLGLMALGTVAAVALLIFRGRVLTASMSLAPVVLGPLWALGLWGLGGGILDVISLGMLPFLIGIGIDDGVHALVAARRPDAQGLASGLREAGPPMLLTTLTTSAGFGSLMLSQLPGLRHGGSVVALGVFCCLVATVLLSVLDRGVRE